MFWCKPSQIFVLGLKKTQTWVTSIIVIIHFEPLYREMEDSLWTLSTVLAPISLLLTHLRNMNGLEQTLQSKDLSLSAKPPEVTSSLIPLPPKGSISTLSPWICGFWPALLAHTLEADVQGSSFPLLHPLTNGCCSLIGPGRERLISFMCSPKGPLEDRSAQSLLTFQDPSASWLYLLLALPSLAHHGLQAISSRQASALLGAFPLLFLVMHILLLPRQGSCSSPSWATGKTQNKGKEKWFKSQGM